MAIEAVVFDIGNVLLEWKPERVYDDLIGQEARVALFERVPLEKMNMAVDRGAPFRDTVYGLAEQYPDDAQLIRLWHDRWTEMASPTISGSVHLLRALRAKGVPVFILSNIGVETFAIARQRYSFLDEFDRVYLSGELQLLKPEPEIYAHVEQNSRVSPEALLFADDRADNIAAAAERGWAVHQFQGAQGWADTLVEHGLLTKDEAAL